MAKSTRLSFSKEHTGRSSGKREVDTYRQRSDSSSKQKVDHSTLGPGYREKSTSVRVNKK